VCTYTYLEGAHNLTMSHFRSLRVLLLLALVSLVLAGCMQGAVVAQGAGSLVVYSGRSESLVGPIIDQFRDASGIDVSVKYGGTAEIAATLLEEGENSPADVFFAQDPSGLGTVAAMLGPLPDDILDTVPEWARSPEGNWVGVSGRARVVAYNTNVLDDADLPSSLMAFTGPEWKGRIGWPPANGSFQAMVTAMRVQWGEEKTRGWLQGIQANEPIVYAKNTPTVAAAASGEIDVGFVNHYYVHRFLQESGDGFGARNHFLDGGGPGGIVLVAGSGILSTADNRENAERLLRFVLSTVAQQYFASQTFEYPLVDGVKTARELPPLSDLRNPNIDMASLGDLKGTQALLRDLGIIP
jgi:iron(III) transport system substrate-binding protein